MRDHQTAEPPPTTARHGPARDRRADRPHLPRTGDPRQILRVGVVDEFPLIVHGLAAMLAPYAPAVVVHAGLPGTAGPGPVDITLYDPASCASVRPTALANLLGDPARGRVLIYSFDPAPTLVDEWLAAGCAGFVDKRTTAAELVAAMHSLITRHRRGGRAGPTTAQGSRPRDGSLLAPDDWPGKEHGLSRRESEMLALITRGLTNHDISAGCGLSINTVKTYIRSAYGKLEITRRPEAVRWGVQHGMLGPSARMSLRRPTTPTPETQGPASPGSGERPEDQEHLASDPTQVHDAPGQHRHRVAAGAGPTRTGEGLQSARTLPRT